MKLKLLAGLMAMAAIAGTPESNACSRILYKGNDSLLIVGRSLDWRTPIPTNVYVYPAGIAKKGHNLPGAVTWTSKYGAVYAVGYDFSARALSTRTIPIPTVRPCRWPCSPRGFLT